MILFGGPKSYLSYAEFEREELRPMQRVGFSVADLESEATFQAARDYAEREPNELDFD